MKHKDFKDKSESKKKGKLGTLEIKKLLENGIGEKMDTARTKIVNDKTLFKDMVGYMNIITY